jgi:hypothetical protein
MKLKMFIGPDGKDIERQVNIWHRESPECEIIKSETTISYHTIKISFNKESRSRFGITMVLTPRRYRFVLLNRHVSLELQIRTLPTSAARTR